MGMAITTTPTPTPTMAEAAASAPWPAELFIWFSPGFPVGSYAYSHGLEMLVAEGRVRDRASLNAWVEHLFAHGSARNDGILLALAHDAARSADCARFAALCEQATALAPTAERAAEAAIQGAAFLAAIRAAWIPDAPRHAPYPVAVGWAAGARGLNPAATLTVFGQAFAANLVSAAIRLSVIGQFDGQRVLADLTPAIGRATSLALAATADDIASASLMTDLASAAHETLHTRLFRS